MAFDILVLTLKSQPTLDLVMPPPLLILARFLCSVLRETPKIEEVINNGSPQILENAPVGYEDSTKVNATEYE